MRGPKMKVCLNTDTFMLGHYVDDGIVISLRGKVIPNHGLVTTEDIGIDPTGTNLTVGRTFIVYL